MIRSSLKDPAAISRGQDAIVDHVQRVMRAASIRPSDLGVQWCEAADGSRRSLKLRWGDVSFEMVFSDEDVAEWSTMPNFTDGYRSELYRLIDWLVSRE